MKAKTARRWIAVYSAVLAMGVGLGTLAHAAKGGGTRSMRTNNNSNNNQPAIEVPAVDSKAADQAKQDLVTARADRKKADDNLSSVVARLREEFEKSPAITQAMADLKAAQDAYTASSKPALEKVHQTSEYKAAVSAKGADEAKILDLHGQSGADAQIATLAQDAMKEGSAATKLENDAIAQDPTALAAKAKVTEAGVAISKLRAQFNASLNQNADWQAAKKALDDSVQKLETAEATYRTESGKLASAQAAHDAAQAKKDLQERAHANARNGKNNNPPDNNNPNPPANN